MEPEYFLKPEEFHHLIRNAEKSRDRITLLLFVQITLNSLAERAGLQLTKYIDRAGRNRRRITPHLLRHSFAVWSLDSGAPIHDFKELLGHSTIIATTVYVQATPTTGWIATFGKGSKASWYL